MNRLGCNEERTEWVQGLPQESRQGTVTCTGREAVEAKKVSGSESYLREKALREVQRERTLD